MQWIEATLDQAAQARPNRGAPPHRPNRAEYANAIGDLLGVEMDAASLLPPDDSAYGFDNIASALSVSSGLMERYLGSASRPVAPVEAAAAPTEYDGFRPPSAMSDAEGKLKLARRHLERVLAAWDTPTDWDDLSLYGFYCLEDPPAS